MGRNIILSLMIVLAGLILAGSIYSSYGEKVTSLPEGYRYGVKNGKLAPCRDYPNCICTDHKGSNYGHPFTITPSSWKELLSRVENIKGCSIIEQKEGYIRMECSSGFFGFIDDVELLFDEENHLLRYRSGARLGYYDFGVNRKRIERIKQFVHNKGKEI